MLHFFLSIKVISKNYEPPLCQERRLKRGEIAGWTARESIRRVTACVSVLQDTITGGDNEKAPGSLKLKETTAICCSTQGDGNALLIIKMCKIQSDTPVFPPMAPLCLSIIRLSLLTSPPTSRICFPGQHWRIL